MNADNLTVRAEAQDQKSFCFSIHDSLLISTQILLRSILPPLRLEGLGEAALPGFLRPPNFDKLSYRKGQPEKV